MNKKNRNSRHILGFLLILLGLVIFANNLNWIPENIAPWIWTWEMLIIVIGVILLVSKPNKGPGIVLILIGGFFLAVDYFDDVLYLHKIFWPSLIIFVGLMFIFRSRKDPFNDPEEIFSDEDFVDEMAIFGGGQKVITARNFKGGKVTSIFGGSTLDLSQARLANGISVIDMVSIFGGAKLIVPRDWDIHLEVTAIFGGFMDKRIVDPHIIPDPSKKLVIKGVAIFGGGELNYL